jgi:hypothetical protein
LLNCVAYDLVKYINCLCSVNCLAYDKMYKYWHVDFFTCLIKCNIWCICINIEVTILCSCIPLLRACKVGLHKVCLTGHLLSIPKKENKVKVNVEKMISTISRHWMHKLQEKISLLVSLTSAPGHCLAFSYFY